STPLGTGTALNHPAQPEALMLDADGNLLVGLSPDHNGNGAVEELDQNGNYVATIASGIGTPSGLGYVPQLSVMSVAPADWPTTGPAGLTLKRDGNGLLHIYDSTGDVVPAQSLDNVGEIQVNGPDNTASTLTIDFGPGSPIPLDGVSFAGGANSGTNTIIISGSSDLSGTIQTTGTGSVILGQGS